MQRRLEVDVAQSQAHQLGDAQPGAVQHLEDGPVPPGDRVVADHRADQGLDLGLAERLGQAGRHPRGLDPGAGIAVRPTLLGQEAVERPHGHHGAGHGGGREALGAQGAHVVLEVRLGDLVEDGAPPPQPCPPPAGVSPVGGQGGGSAPLLGRQPRQPLLDVERQGPRIVRRVVGLWPTGAGVRSSGIPGREIAGTGGGLGSGRGRRWHPTTVRPGRPQHRDPTIGPARSVRRQVSSTVVGVAALPVGRMWSRRFHPNSLA